ncbi:MAG: endolytic transglycosylase MltG [Lachnospiraceae bacterium]|nr:endolytic transglycosylase MltG [Lachnospiraceae bacterium]
MERKRAKKVNEVTGVVIRGALSLIFYAVVAAFVLTAVRWGYQFGYDIFNGKPMTNGPQVTLQYTVEEEESIRTIAGNLEEAGLIKDRWIMIIQKVFYDYNIIPGTYELNSGMTSKEILEWMTKLSNAIVEEEPSEGGEEAASASEDGGE